MNYFDFLEMVIDDGIEAVKDDYIKPEQKQKLDGSIAGFNACRKKTPEELLKILFESERTAQQCFQERIEEYLYYRCYQLEVEWTCNVVSAMLYNERLAGREVSECIINPTARGMFKADEILKRGNLITNN